MWFAEACAGALARAEAAQRPTYGRRSTVQIEVDASHHVGTDAHPYHARDPLGARREAIRAGVARRVRAGMSEPEAAVNVKQRLNAIRTLSRRRKACLALEEDLYWMDATLMAGKPDAVTSPVCTFYPRDPKGSMAHRIGRLLWAWWHGPSYLVRTPAGDVKLEVAAEGEDARDLLTRDDVAAVVWKSASTDEFDFWLSYIADRADRAVLRKLLRAHTPLEALAVVRAHLSVFTEADVTDDRLLYLRQYDRDAGAEAVRRRKA